MNAETNLLSRVEKAMGPSAATLFAERGTDRHFIVELTLSGVALYVLGKYLDGFMEGLGVKELGKKHAHAIKDAIGFGYDVFSTAKALERKALEQHARDLSAVAVDLREHRAEKQALDRASATLHALLDEAGIPLAEAQRIAGDIAHAVWLP